MRPTLRRCLQIDAKAVRYAKSGNPSSVLKMESIRLDTASLQPADVVVRILAAPITAVDLAQVRGAPAWPSACPSKSGGARVGGNEGLGEVMHCSTGNSGGLKQGDLVVAAKPGLGTWATHVVAPASAWAPVPGAIRKGALEPVAAGVAPYLAAKAMLEGFVKLQKGDVVVQNNGGSLVAQAVVQLAAAKGLRSVTLVAPGGGIEWSALSPHLTALGGTLVLGEGDALKHEFLKTMRDLPPGALGLNGSGGSAANSVARALARGATLVTYGAARRREAALSAALDLFTVGDLSARGFSLQAWAEKQNGAALAADIAAAAAACASEEGGGKELKRASVSFLVAREPFEDFSAALKRATAAVTDRPVVLRMK